MFSATLCVVLCHEPARGQRLTVPHTQDSRSLQLRVASLWLLHNLVYRRSLSSSSTIAGRRPHEILDKLRAMGLEAKLRMLERDPELDVRERVRDLREMLG